MTRRGYPGDDDDDTYHFLEPYLLLHRPDAGQRKHPIRDVLNAFLWMVRTGAQWAYLPHDFPLAEAVRQLSQRWVVASCFENATHDLRILARAEYGRAPEPSAVVMDGRTLQSTPESGHRAVYDGAKKRKGIKHHLVVDTLEHLLAIPSSPANEQNRAQVKGMCLEVQEATGAKVDVAFED